MHASIVMVLFIGAVVLADTPVGPTLLSKLNQQMTYGTDFRALASPFTPNTGGILTAFGMYADDSLVTGTASYSLSLWSHDPSANMPSQQLAHTATENQIPSKSCNFVSLQTDTANVKWVALEANIRVTAGQQYWLVITATIGGGHLGIGVVDGGADVTNRWAKTPSSTNWVKFTSAQPVLNMFIYIAGTLTPSPTAQASSLPPTTKDLGWNPTNLNGLYWTLTSAVTEGASPFAVPFTLQTQAGANVVYALKSFGIWVQNVTGRPTSYSGQFRFALYSSSQSTPTGPALASVVATSLQVGRNDIALPSPLLFTKPPTAGTNFFIYFISSVDSLPVRSVPGTTAQLQAEFVRTCAVPNFAVESLSWQSSNQAMLVFTTWAVGDPSAATTAPVTTTATPVSTSTAPSTSSPAPSAPTTAPPVTSATPTSTGSTPTGSTPTSTSGSATPTSPSGTPTNSLTSTASGTPTGSDPVTTIPESQYDEPQGEIMRSQHLTYGTDFRALAYPWTATNSGTLTAFGVYVVSNVTITGTFSLALHTYVDGATVPGDQLATTATVSALNPTACNFLNLADDMFEVKLPSTAPFDIAAGATYWIVFYGDAPDQILLGLTDKPAVSTIWAKIPSNTDWTITTPLPPINLFVYTQTSAPPAGLLGTVYQTVGFQTAAATVINTFNGEIDGATFAWLVPFEVPATTSPRDVSSFISFGVVVEDTDAGAPPVTYSGSFLFALFSSNVDSNLPTGKSLASQTASQLVTGLNNISLSSPVALSPQSLYWIWFGTATNEVPLRVGPDPVSVASVTFSLRSAPVRACAVPDFTRESPLLDQFTETVNVYGVITTGAAAPTTAPSGSTTPVATGPDGSPVPTDSNGSPIPQPTDANGNPIPTGPNGSPVPTDANGSPVPTGPDGSPVPTDANGSPIPQPTDSNGNPIPTGNIITTSPGNSKTPKPKPRHSPKWKLVVKLRLDQCAADLDIITERLSSLFDLSGQYYVMTAKCSNKRANPDGTIEYGSDTTADVQRANLNRANGTASQQPETLSSQVVPVKKSLAWWIIVIIVLLLILVIIVVIVVIVGCFCCAVSVTAWCCAKLCCCCNSKEENEDYELMLGRGELPQSEPNAGTDA